MTVRMKWMSAALALLLVLVILPVGVQAQGGPGQGNPPPGQVKERGPEGDPGNNAAAGVNELGRLTAQGDDPVQDARLINVRAERFIGLPVINLAGKQIGAVSDILINVVGHRQSGNPQRPASGGQINSARADYVVVQVGGTMGWGAKAVPVPLTALRLHLVDGQRLGIDDNLVYFEGTDPGNEGLAVRKEFFNQNALLLVSDLQDLNNAPQYNLDGLRDVANPTWDRSLRAYWQGLGAAWPETPVGEGAAYRVVSGRNLGRFGLRELGGDGLGAIEDVLLALTVANPRQVPAPAVALSGVVSEPGNTGVALNTGEANSGERATVAARALEDSLPIVDVRVEYALVRHGGWWGWGAQTTPLPFGMLISDRNYDQRSVYVEADRDLLGNAPTVNSRQANELNDGNFFSRVRAYWQDAGFWPGQ